MIKVGDSVKLITTGEIGTVTGIYEWRPGHNMYTVRTETMLKKVPEGELVPYEEEINPNDKVELDRDAYRQITEKLTRSTAWEECFDDPEKVMIATLLSQVVVKKLEVELFGKE